MQQFWFTAAVFFLVFFHIPQRSIADFSGFVFFFFPRTSAANCGGLWQFLRVFFTYLSGQLGRIAAVFCVFFCLRFFFTYLSGQLGRIAAVFAGFFYVS